MPRRSALVFLCVETTHGPALINFDHLVAVASNGQTTTIVTVSGHIETDETVDTIMTRMDRALGAVGR